jgi:response regulator NasT
MLRIMLFDESSERSHFLRLALEGLGHDIVAEVPNARLLYDEVHRHQPDAIIIGTDSPSRDTLEHLCMITANCPRPIVMFTQDAKRQSIRDAVRAGVTAYVVDGLAPERVAPIIEAALARFEAFQSVHTELAQAKSKLSERKLIDRAKGILMQEKKLSEEDAYRLLRKLAMDRSAPLGTVAEQVITYAKLLS